MSDSLQNDPRAGARRTLLALSITMLALFVGSVMFMVLQGGKRIPEGRPLLVVLPFGDPDAGAGEHRYSGMGRALATYFGRTDPRELGVLGPASTERLVIAGSDPLAVGRELEADLVLVGREAPGEAAPILVVELFRVDDGTLLWKGEFEAGADVDLRTLQTRIATEVTEVMDLPR